MNVTSKKYVYHGSHERFDIAEPKRHIRAGKIDKKGNREIIFDSHSFHATPYKWIALAYTYNPKPYEIDGKVAHYSMGVSLYDDVKKISVMGFESLEKSLKKLYGDGGYLYIFEKEKFFHTKGLGNLEVIAQESIKPFKVERINDPVFELRKLGVRFNFFDLGKPENEEYRNHF